MRASTQVAAAVLLLCLFGPSPAWASKKFLADESGHPHSALFGKAFSKDVMSAMGFMLGCGEQITEDKIAAIEKSLMPMWRTLPKNSGRIDRRSLRYLVHRHFMQTSSLMIRGFEPSRTVNSSHWGVADILSEQVPGFVESVLESSHATQYGFELQDAVHMVIMLERLIFDAEATLLDKVYAHQRKPKERHVRDDGLRQVLQTYMASWMIEASPEELNDIVIEETIPQYQSLMEFIDGQIKAFQYNREHKPWVHHGKDTMNNRYSFDDAHEIVGGITRSFQSYWESECASMKLSLVEMDTHNTGRVPLTQFYKTTIDGEWRFGESEAYLRELGALDETSSFLEGPQVIIPNYMQAASNCIVTTHHYLICCMSECEAIIDEIEASIGKPVAMPEQVLAVMQNVTVEASSLEGAGTRPKVAPKLVAQLKWIATSNGGRILLHGRLFAQWLHYLFPQECPFPHIQGSTKAMTPSEFGETYIATEEEMRLHTENSTASNMSLLGNEENVLSLWSAEEEFVVDYAPHHFDAVWGLLPWSRHLAIFMLSTAILLLGIVGAGHHAESAGPKMLKEYF
mmetsp:Transcript_109061/g.178017  ORF Transcript_109061/g.178017 Transcript_109061/m.178017 type:complete len:570 (-) Transcript_109061:72-1781(-)